MSTRRSRFALKSLFLLLLPAVGLVSAAWSQEKELGESAAHRGEGVVAGNRGEFAQNRC